MRNYSFKHTRIHPLFFSFLTLIYCFLLVPAKGNAQQSKLIGTWRVDTDKTITIMDNESKRQYDTLSTEVKTRAVNAMQDREFTFSENGEVTVKWKARDEQRISTGEWKMDENNRLVITIDNQTAAYDIEFKSQKEMIWKGQGRRGFFNNLYLQKR